MGVLRTVVISAKDTGRFTIVRLVSRGGDLLISNVLIFRFGESWFYPAIMFAALFNCSSEYLGNKFWTFKEIRAMERDTTDEVLLYLTIRGFYGMFGFVALFLLYKVLSIPYLASSLIIATIMWFLTFQAFQGLFSGLPRGLPRTLRRARLIFKYKRIRSV